MCVMSSVWVSVDSYSNARIFKKGIFGEEWEQEILLEIGAFLFSFWQGFTLPSQISSLLLSLWSSAQTGTGGTGGMFWGALMAFRPWDKFTILVHDYAHIVNILA